MSVWDEIKELHRRSTFGAKEGLAFKLFSRPLASFILYFIQNSRITPNQVTIISLIVGLIGSAVHIFDLTYRGLLVGGVLFMIAHMLDALDGQLARHRKAGSVIGMYFDFSSTNSRHTSSSWRSPFGSFAKSKQAATSHCSTPSSKAGRP